MSDDPTKALREWRHTGTTNVPDSVHIRAFLDFKRSVPDLITYIEGLQALLVDADKALSYLEFEDGVPRGWPAEAFVSSVRTRIGRALRPAPPPEGGKR